MSILQNRKFYINSENRIEGTSSNFSYKIEVPEAGFNQCCVLAMTIPKSYYLVRDGHNQFKLTTSGQTHVITVPPGNYFNGSFISTVLPMLNAFGTFTMTYVPVTGKFAYTTATDVTFEFSSQLARQFGFDEKSTNTFLAGPFTSKNVLDFNPTNTLFLHSDMVDDTTNILQEVYSDNTVPFANIVYTCNNPMMYSKKLNKHGSSVFNFTLTDEHQEEVFLNGHDICITLMMYRKENLTALFQKIFPPAEEE